MKILTSLIAVALLATAGATFAELRQGAYVIGASGGTITGGDISAMVVMGEPISGTVETGEMEMEAGFIPVYVHTGVILSAPEDENLFIPQVINLGNAYPNPFNSSTTITYSLPFRSQVALRLYDLRGRLVTDIFGGNRSPGIHTTTLTADNLPSGLYFIRLEAGDQVATQKVMLVR